MRLGLRPPTRLGTATGPLFLPSSRVPLQGLLPSLDAALRYFGEWFHARAGIQLARSHQSRHPRDTSGPPIDSWLATVTTLRGSHSAERHPGGCQTRRGTTAQRSSTPLAEAFLTRRRLPFAEFSAFRSHAARVPSESRSARRASKKLLQCSPFISPLPVFSQNVANDPRLLMSLASSGQFVEISTLRLASASNVVRATSSRRGFLAPPSLAGTQFRLQVGNSPSGMHVDLRLCPRQGSEVPHLIDWRIPQAPGRRGNRVPTFTAARRSVLPPPPLHAPRFFRPLVNFRRTAAMRVRARELGTASAPALRALAWLGTASTLQLTKNDLHCRRPARAQALAAGAPRPALNRENQWPFAPRDAAQASFFLSWGKLQRSVGLVGGPEHMRATCDDRCEKVRESARTCRYL